MLRGRKRKLPLNFVPQPWISSDEDEPPVVHHRAARELRHDHDILERNREVEHRDRDNQIQNSRESANDVGENNDVREFREVEEVFEVGEVHGPNDVEEHIEANEVQEYVEVQEAVEHPLHHEGNDTPPDTAHIQDDDDDDPYGEESETLGKLKKKL